MSLNDVFESKERFKKWFFACLKANAWHGITNILLIVILVVVVMNEKEPGVVAVTKDFRAVPLTVLSEPTVQDPGLIQYVYDAIPSALSLDFDNPQRTIDDAIHYFSPGAYRDYQALLAEQNWVAMTQKSLLVRCVVTDVPRIVNRYLQKGVATWEIQVPVSVTVESTNDVLSRNNWVISMKIQRCDLTKRANGIWITLFQFN